MLRYAYIVLFDLDVTSSLFFNHQNFPFVCKVVGSRNMTGDVAVQNEFEFVDDEFVLFFLPLRMEWSSMRLLISKMTRAIVLS